MTCEHYRPDGAGGVNCQSRKINCSFGVCFRCPLNTARGLWPTKGADGKFLSSGIVPAAKTPPPVIEAIPRDEWPLRVKAFALLRTDADAGVGDTAQRIAGKFGGEWLKAKYKELMGENCGCENRQARMNRKYPYS